MLNSTILDSSLSKSESLSIMSQKESPVKNIVREEDILAKTGKSVTFKDNIENKNCKVCNMKFDNNEDLFVHMSFHMDMEDPLDNYRECEDCKVLFKSKELKRIHMIDVHMMDICEEVPKLNKEEKENKDLFENENEVAIEKESI